MKFLATVIAGCCALSVNSLPAKTVRVGPERSLKTLQEAAPLLGPGDVLEVDGNATYRGMVVFGNHGTAQAPITVRGVAREGHRPVLSGAGGVARGAVVKFTGDHYVFEGFDATAGADTGAYRVLYNVADDVAIRDTVVHDAACVGIHGSDSSGSLTLERVEVYRCGAGDMAHQVYVATDNARYPGARFRMQFCFIHDGAGGNNVKSRAGRNEIYHNWIEGAAFHELDLIGADVKAQKPGTAGRVREDSDVVGNVLLARKTSRGFIARLGSDGTGASDGRYRFANNTIIIDPSVPGVPAVLRVQSVMRVKGAAQSVEMHNNVIWHGGRAVRVFYEERPGAAAVFASAGSCNWLPRGSVGVPSGWSGTICGADPGFQDGRAFDFMPAEGSPLMDAGEMQTRSPRGFEFLRPLSMPAFHPPVKGALAGPRPVYGDIDIGAFERAPKRR